MRIEEISISRYKSLYDVSLEFGRLSILAGPNNAGKSNAADAIDFLAEVYRFDLNLALQRRGGFENVAFRRMRRTKQSIDFQVSAVIDSESLRRIRLMTPPRVVRGAQFRVTHSFSFKAKSQRLQTEFEVVSETLAVNEQRNGTDRQIILVVRHGTDIRVDVAPDSDGRRRGAVEPIERVTYPFNDASFQTFLRNQTWSGRLLAETFRFNALLQYFANEMAQMRVYQLTPLEARRSGTPTPGAGLEKHGANLPTVVSDLRRRSDPIWSTVLEAMRRVMPGLVDIDVTYTPDRRMTLQFHEAAIGRPWSVDEVSDGTIQSLALFVAIVEASGPLLLIEEPENSLHPWIVRVILDLCRQVEDKQIVLTTHSPVLLNYVEPGDVYLVWQHQHQTHISGLTQIDPKAETTWQKGHAIFDLLDTGMIPEAIPSGSEFIGIPDVVGEDEDSQA